MAKKIDVSMNFDEYFNATFGDKYRSDRDLKCLKVISSGSLSFDASTGIGGIPRGRVTFIYGRPGTGKSHLAISTAINALSGGLSVLYIDTEGGTDQELIEQMLKFYGIDYIVSDNDNDVLDYTIYVGDARIRCIKVEVFEDALKMVEVAIRTGDFEMVVFDSISAASPEEELAKELTESTMMIQSKLLAKFFRRNIFKILLNSVAAVFIGQVRDKVGAYVPTVVSTGGLAIQHYTTLETFLNAGNSAADFITVGKEKVGRLITFTIKKNKVGVPFRQYTIPLLFGRGIDRYSDLCTFAKMLGILQGIYYAYKGESIGQGLANTVKRLKGDTELYNSIRNDAIEMLKSTDDSKEDILKEGTYESDNNN